MKRAVLPLLFCLSALTIRAVPSAVISQILYDTPLNEQITAPPYSNGEFVEIYNAGDTPLQLSGWSLSGDGKTERYTFPAGTELATGEYLLVAYRHKRTPQFTLKDLYGDMVSGKTVLYQNNVVLSNGGESLVLRDADHSVADSIYYDGTSHKLKHDRLSADNPDSIAGSLCHSLQRVAVAYDAYGRAATDNAHWETQKVSFGSIVPAPTEYITSDFYWDKEQPLSAGSNYIISVVPLDESNKVSFDHGTVQLESGKRVSIAVTLFDALNRPSIQILKAASPTRQDLVTYTEYDDSQRSVHTWQTVAVNEPASPLPSALCALAQSQYNDSKPYQSITKEVWNDGRVVRTASAGTAYQEHPSHTSYTVNDATVPRFTVTQDGFRAEGEYAVGTLRITTVTDPDGKQISVYRDGAGRKVVFRQGDNNDTYYLYDDLDRLRYTLPPAVTAHLSASSSYRDSDSLLQHYAYIYRYDKAGHVVSKHVPGCEDVYFVYDRSGRPVLQQDGNQRARGNYWTVLKYDAYGRLAYTTEMEMMNSSHQDLTAHCAECAVTETFAVSGHNYPMDDTGYSCNYYHNHPAKLLTVNYYDTYDFLLLLPQDTAEALRYQEKADYGVRHENTTGMLTGTRVYNLYDNQYTTTAYYYDAQGNIIQSRATDGAEGYDITYAAYNLDGTRRLVSAEHKSHLKTIKEQYTCSYDHAGRPTQVHYRQNAEPSIMLSETLYDEHGNVSASLRHNRADTTVYAYDVHGAPVTSVNSRFSERLFYGEGLPEGTTPYYNGNIAAVSLSIGDSVRTFAYTYDAYNRLTESRHLAGGKECSSEFFEFDKMGNITRLQRHSTDNRLIDDLQFSYVGNQMVNATDYAGSLDRYDTKEYQDYAAAAGTPEQDYDVNGNMVRDDDRGIRAIRYNLLNLPDTIYFNNGNRIIHSYDAAGRKRKTLSVTLRENRYLFTGNRAGCDSTLADTVCTWYAGNVEYHYAGHETAEHSPDIRCIVHNDEGYSEYADGTGTPVMYYHYRDHLGNNCVVWDAIHDKVVQETWYYASGMPMDISTGQGQQSYKYNGKEYIEMHGYDTYDYGFRGYYATTGRFTSTDPLAECTPWQSPYAYANNNWSNRIDAMGLLGTGFAQEKYSWAAVDNFGKVLKSDMTSPDRGVYLVDDDDWDGTYDGLLTYPLVGWQYPGEKYIPGEYPRFIGVNLDGVFMENGFGFFLSNLSFGSHRAEESMDDFIMDLAKDVMTSLGIANDIVGNFRSNEFFWIGKNGRMYCASQAKNNYVYQRSRNLAKIRNAPFKKVTSIIGNVLGVVEIGVELADIAIQGAVNPSNIINCGIAVLSVASLPVLGPYIGICTTLYVVSDMATGWITGESISHRLDRTLGPIIQW